MRNRSGLKRTRSAFTIIEIMIVVIMIGMLIVMLLPAVQSCREAARRVSCRSNLANLALGCQSYYSVHQVFPAGSLGYREPVIDFPDDYHHNWLVQLLPHTQGQNLASQIDSQRSVYDPVNRPLFEDRSSSILCPSEWAYGLYSSYAGVFSGRKEPVSPKASGMLIQNRFLRQQDIADGLSMTLLLGEKMTAAKVDLGWTSGSSATLRTTGLPIDNNHAGRSELFRGSPIENAYGWFLGDHKQSLEQYQNSEDTPEFDGSVAHDAQDSFDMVAPEFPTAPATIVGPLAESQLQFGSYHSGGAQFAFGDGHVAFIAMTIDQSVYAELGNRDDQGPLEAPR